MPIRLTLPLGSHHGLEPQLQGFGDLATAIILMGIRTLVLRTVGKLRFHRQPTRCELCQF